jgi:hypothetical protein
MHLRVLMTAALAATWAVALPWWFARRRSGYSHLRQTLSELGEAGAPQARAVAWVAFAPLGLLVILVALLLRGHLPAGGEFTQAMVLLSLLGASYLCAAVFPCDPGAPAWGSWHNQLHNLGGALGYGGSAVGLIELGRALEDVRALAPLAGVTGACGMAVFFGLFLLSFESPVRGLVQRLMETLLFGWMLLMGVWVALVLR